MEPIVSPWFIYLLGVVGSFHFAFGVGFIVLLIVSAVAWIIFGISYGDSYSTEKEEMAKKYIPLLKKMTTWTVIILILGIFVPSKNTMIGMYVANEVTYGRAGKAIEVTKDVKDELKKDVLDIIQALNKKEKEEKAE